MMATGCARGALDLRTLRLPFPRTLPAATLVLAVALAAAPADAATVVEYDPFEETVASAACEADCAADCELGCDGADEVTQCVYQVSRPAPVETLPMTGSNAPSMNDGGSAAVDWMPPPLGELTTNIVLPSGLLPRDHAAERTEEFGGYFDPCGATRGWPLSGVVWEASCFCHRPLYFEEINLERYGYGFSECLQPAVSACHFFGTVPALPYKAAVDPPWECDYALGHYRPGSCPPWRYHCCSRVSGLGALSAAGVATGLVFLIP